MAVPKQKRGFNPAGRGHPKETGPRAGYWPVGSKAVPGRRGGAGRVEKSFRSCSPNAGINGPRRARHLRSGFFIQRHFGTGGYFGKNTHRLEHCGSKKQRKEPKSHLCGRCFYTKLCGV